MLSLVDDRGAVAFLESLHGKKVHFAAEWIKTKKEKELEILFQLIPTMSNQGATVYDAAEPLPDVSGVTFYTCRLGCNLINTLFDKNLFIF